MPMIAPLNALVHTLRYEAQDTISIELHAADGGPLPPFDAGSHIDLHLPGGLIRSYSLLNDPAERHRYVVAVLKDRASRGGSRWVHEQLRVGTVLTISAPRNAFKLHEDAAHTVLVAGGIGITPLLCMARRLRSIGRSVELLYFARTRKHAALVGEIEALGLPVHWHLDDEAGGPPNLPALLASRTHQAAAHYYACGPAVMLDAFEKSCAELGITNAHVERFSPVAVAAANDARTSYTVHLQRSGREVSVAPPMSLLQTLKAAGCVLPTSCEEGVCGACETKVLAGTPDHRDSLLSAAEKAANTSMMICVSGCKSDSLTLDL